jgi:guanylate kinase
VSVSRAGTGRVNQIASGRLFVVSGPSGVGKGTLRKALFESVDNLVYSISCTTRSPRKGEKDGYDYRFISQESFRRLAEEGMFLEWAEVHGNLYGTLKEDVVAALSKGKDVVLEIDVQGAARVKEAMPDSVLLFILPPSENELLERLSRRGTESIEEVRARFEGARQEIELSGRYDHVIVNDFFKRALGELAGIVEKYRQSK